MKIDATAFKQRIEAFREEVKKEGEKIVRQALAEFFNECPEVLKIRWRQYTPYFNDGDECVFSVREAYVLLKDKTENVSTEDLEGGDYDDGYISEYELARKKLDNVKSNLSQLNSILGVASDSLKVAFGDHSTITADREKIDVDEYDHD